MSFLDYYFKFHQLKVAFLMRVWLCIYWVVYKMFGYEGGSKTILIKKDFDVVSIKLLSSFSDSKNTTAYMAALCRLYGTLCMEVLEHLGLFHLISGIFCDNGTQIKLVIDLKAKQINGIPISFDQIMI